MGYSGNMQKRLLALSWKDFVTYPAFGSTIMVRAKGYDANKKKWIDKFIKVDKFNPFDFPQEDISKELMKHHAKWWFYWLPFNEVESSVFNVKLKV